MPPYRVQVGIGAGTDNEASLHNGFCLYTRALEFPAESEDLNNSSSASFPEQLDASSVLLFNMAISYHLKGLQSGGTAEKLSQYLHLALSIYKMIETLLVGTANQDEEDNYNNNSSNASLKILRMAVYSNMGHIHSHFFALSEEVRCRETIFQLLYHGDEESREGDNANVRRAMAEDEYVVFFLNTACLNPSMAKQWAPAA